MKKSNQTILFAFLSVIFSLSLVRADLVSPVGFIAFPFLAAIVIGVIALIAWLIIRKIKKKNASKSNK